MDSDFVLAVPREAMSDRNAADIAAEILDVSAQLRALETLKEHLRTELTVALSAHTVSQPTTWDLGRATVTWVKGSERKTLDRGKLVRAGVTTEQLEAATVVSVGKATIRVEAKDAEENRGSADAVVREAEAQG